MLDINWNPSPRDLRQFGLLWLPLFAAVLGYAVFRRTGEWPIPIAIWGVAAAVALVALVAPARLRPLVVAWIAAAYPIGWTISHLVLGITYFVLFAIIGLTLRLVGYDSLARRKAAARSFWHTREARRSAASYFRQF
ncbi:MAG TPA: SxtJ family membrane protein [Vicinamibacterales bacterium]|nr:SxtJ family membrane protein [Vicinamibacterales bacterium]